MMPCLNPLFIRAMHLTDGAGVMYFHGAQLKVRKVMPSVGTKTWGRYPDELYVANVRQLLADACAQADDGTEIAIHLRMRTHGDIDELNTHPYQGVGYDVETCRSSAFWLMHNGVLSHGNASDPSKSDTWHYIRHTLEPLLDTGEIRVLFDPVFQRLIEKDIGNNRFVVALEDDEDHRMVIYNKHQGVMHKGAWFSNTYAWTAPDTTRYGVASLKDWATGWEPVQDDSSKPSESDELFFEDLYQIFTETTEGGIPMEMQQLAQEFIDLYDRADLVGLQALVDENIDELSDLWDQYFDAA